MSRCFAEFFRVLKPGRWMTVEFSNHSNDVWLRIQNALASAGFVVADTRVIDKEQLSYRQVTAEHAVKHDLVISAYKPAEATERTFGLAAGSADGAWAFVREHLSRVPAAEGARGQALVVRERQADRIYERMVGYHVARNTLVPMTAAEFYTGLEQRFAVRDAMYFLPDQVEAYERFRITFKELAAQELFIRDESSAVQWLRQLLKDRLRASADIQPLFMRELQSGLASWEELPDLRAMLEANFISDDRGRFAVPDPKKTEHLDQLRTRALLKEFEGYKIGNARLNRFRSEAVRAGFKEAWARKDFATITAVGRRLPSDVFVEDSALLHYFRAAERLAGRDCGTARVGVASVGQRAGRGTGALRAVGARDSRDHRAVHPAPSAGRRCRARGSIVTAVARRGGYMARGRHPGGRPGRRRRPACRGPRAGVAAATSALHSGTRPGDGSRCGSPSATRLDSARRSRPGRSSRR